MNKREARQPRRLAVSDELKRADSLARLAMSWALYGLGHAVSRLPRYPYTLYNRLMIWSSDLQTGERGPWRNVQPRYDLQRD
jgi:hypothetical protein